MATQNQGALRRLHLILDTLVVIGSSALASWLHQGLQPFVPLLKAHVPFSEYALLAYLTLPLWLALVVVFNLHTSFERIWPKAGLATRLVQFHVAGLTGLALVGFITQSTINRSIVGLFLLCSFLFMYLVRLLLSSWMGYQHVSGRRRQRLLLAGEPGEAMAAMVRGLREAELAPEVVGYVDDLSVPEQAPAVEGVPFLGELGKLNDVLHESAVDEVIFLPPYAEPERVSSSLVACETLGVPCSFAIDLIKVSRAVPRVSFEHGHAFARYDVAPKHPEALAIKHGLDWLLALLGLAVLWPLLLITALAVLVSMGRPVFFAQARSGLNGRSFRMYKFRTMVLGAEDGRHELLDQNQMSGPVFKIEADPRVTGLGRLLRRYSLDELPQLLNVLTGSMSLVGPRPLPVGEQEQIRGWQRRRLSMKPGITCLWQVSGRSSVDFEDWMTMDLQYIDDWSLALDLEILLKTLPAVLGSRGAH